MLLLRVEPSGAVAECYNVSKTVSGVVPKSWHLNFRLNRQLHSNWCWASIGEACSKQFGKFAYSQRELAAHFFSKKYPSLSEIELELDEEASLDEILRLTGCFSHWSPGRPSFERIQSEIVSNRPVFLSLEWNRSGIHYLCIIGFDAERREIFLDDPSFGPSCQDFDSFPKDYRSAGGVWCCTFWVSPSVTTSL